MKKFLILISSLFLVGGCSKDIVDDYTFQLEGNPSTGFEWTCTSEDDIVDIELSIKATTKDKTLSGAPVLYNYKLIGKSKGKTKINCIYKREWEDNEFDKKVVYDVVVDDDLYVTVSENK